ncbi:conserved hypothetical protein [Caldicellulosiruptor hydrothermalis 108]|uniref:O-antigen polymerase n=1 Tax=Caldicellulosiruptor hydrothermalis (strain DSM 18901 / VKM B-2411 / 108) TaxID=632292 RepID=E4Q9C4_CALH1|nr:hypothetical protein [Caldicellulosiruptor hydrothermalis]ADQ05795.1 conserved hypothetical protein [Caldicellulosiruptor hydrothermalis 108]
MLQQLTKELWQEGKIKTMFSTAGIILYVFYILTGNFSRIIKLSFFPRSISLIEVSILAFVGIFFIYELTLLREDKNLLKKVSLNDLDTVEVLLSLMLLSILVNYIIYKFNILPLLYYLRFFSLVYFAFIIYLFLNFKRNISKIEWFYTQIGLLLCIIGWIIYFIEPDTERLNKFFEQQGIYLNLDPHKFRLIGNIFDPNFFGNILVMFISITMISFLSESLQDKKSLIQKVILLIFFNVTLLKTVSRSSILGLFLVVFFNTALIGSWSFAKKKIEIFKKLILVDSILLFTTLLDKDFYKIFERIKSIPVDNSAHARIQSWNSALDYIEKTPIKLLIGDGYGFLNIKYGLQFIGFDSSFLNLILYCGLLGTVFFLVWLFKKIYKVYQNIRYEELDVKLHFVNLFSLLLTYFVISWFNNLLFYQFWLVLFLPYYYFLTDYGRKG